jgi:hypothetical protein
MVDVDQVREFLEYRDGNLYWRVSLNRRISVGDRAGSFCKVRGYIVVKVNGESFLAHRLIWVIVHGAWPDQIDHINHVRHDNRLENLREATLQENCKNKSMQSNNTSGVMGVVWDKENKKWIARIKVKGKQINLGRYTDKVAAKAKRKMAEVIYGFHPNHGESNAY